MNTFCLSPIIIYMFVINGTFNKVHDNQHDINFQMVEISFIEDQNPILQNFISKTLQCCDFNAINTMVLSLYFSNTTTALNHGLFTFKVIVRLPTEISIDIKPDYSVCKRCLSVVKNTIIISQVVYNSIHFLLENTALDSGKEDPGSFICSKTYGSFYIGQIKREFFIIRMYNENGVLGSAVPNNIWLQELFPIQNDQPTQFQLGKITRRLSTFTETIQISRVDPAYIFLMHHGSLIALSLLNFEKKHYLVEPPVMNQSFIIKMVEMVNPQALASNSVKTTSIPQDNLDSFHFDVKEQFKVYDPKNYIADQTNEIHQSTYRGTPGDPRNMQVVSYTPYQIPGNNLLCNNSTIYPNQHYILDQSNIPISLSNTNYSYNQNKVGNIDHPIHATPDDVRFRANCANETSSDASDTQTGSKSKKQVSFSSTEKPVDSKKPSITESLENKVVGNEKVEFCTKGQAVFLLFGVVFSPVIFSIIIYLLGV